MYNSSMNIYNELFLTTTDTITGIGAPVSVKNKEALFKIKSRTTDKQFIIVVASLDEAKKLKGWTPKATKLAKEVWPGNTTIAVTEDLAVRVPDNTDLQNLLLIKGPCYMTSANHSGQKPLSITDARETFQEINEFFDFGKQSGKASKIIDVKTGEEIR